MSANFLFCFPILKEFTTIHSSSRNYSQHPLLLSLSIFTCHDNLRLHIQVYLVDTDRTRFTAIGKEAPFDLCSLPFLCPIFYHVLLSGYKNSPLIGYMTIF